MDLKHLDRILVPIDFSELSYAALRTALSIAPPERVHVLHVTPVAGGLAWAAQPHGADEAQEAVNRVRARLARDAAGEGLPHADLHVHVRIGAAPHEVVAFANDVLKPNLVVLGSHGRARAVERLFLMGSVAHAVVRHAAAFVLIAR